jgi:uncharacterized protein with HEPN domain/predicted nucleotidyltransferase
MDRWKTAQRISGERPDSTGPPAVGEEILLLLNSSFPVLRKLFGVRKIGIFGPLARGEAYTGVPVLEVEFDRGQDTYANYIGLEFYIEERVKRDVEIVTSRLVSGNESRDPLNWNDEDLMILERVLEECSFIRERIPGIEHDKFLRDGILRRAVSMSLWTIATLCGDVSEVLKERYPGVRWKEIGAILSSLLGTRSGIDPEILWNVLTVEIPAFEAQIGAILRK